MKRGSKHPGRNAPGYRFSCAAPVTRRSSHLDFLAAWAACWNELHGVGLGEYERLPHPLFRGDPGRRRTGDGDQYAAGLENFPRALLRFAAVERSSV